jgi:hypothetical protein
MESSSAPMNLEAKRTSMVSMKTLGLSGKVTDARGGAVKVLEARAWRGSSGGETGVGRETNCWSTEAAPLAPRRGKHAGRCLLHLSTVAPASRG